MNLTEFSKEVCEQKACVAYETGGCDLSATTDLTCANLLIMKPDDENYYVLQKYFLPEGRLQW